MSPPKISVIIPIYNCEKYLPACLQSLSRQTLADIEILAVNNASPDGSQKIINAYAAQDPRVRPLYSQGSMAGGARNEGLNHAHGKYVTFIDSDDFVHPRFCEILYQTAEEQNADVVQCAHVKFTDENTPLPAPQGALTQTLAAPAAAPLDFLKTGQDVAVPWAKLWRRELLEQNGLRFPQGRPHEDIPFVNVCFSLLKCFVRISHPLYYYRLTPGSLSKRTPELFAQSMFENFAFMRGKLKEKGLYTALGEQYEFHLLETLIGGEGSGNGALKKLPRKYLRDFLALCAEFYLNLPPDFFKNRNALFRLKYALFLRALRAGKPLAAQRTLINLFASVYLPLARRKNR